jgi:hypothetical protein
VGGRALEIPLLLMLPGSSQRKQYLAIRLVGEATRRGVWLGRHICHNRTQVSYGELRGDGNLSWTRRGKARFMQPLSNRTHRESAAYRSFAF